MNLEFLNDVPSFHFNCEVKKVEKSWVHPVTDVLHQSTTVSLLPNMSTQLMIFFSKYLPHESYLEPFIDRKPAEYKFWAMIKWPAPHFARLSLCRDNHWVDKNHFHVQTPLTEEYLLGMNGRWFGFGKPTVEVVCYPELEDHQREALEDYTGIIGVNDL